MVEYITLLNQCGEWRAALELLSARQFCPWEGGEGLVSAQYVHAHRELGRAAFDAGDAARRWSTSRPRAITHRI